MRKSIVRRNKSFSPIAIAPVRGMIAVRKMK